MGKDDHMHGNVQTLPVIDMCRRLNRKAADQYRAKGVEPIDVALAAIYSAHDIATVTHGNAHDAIEWMRTALDQMERQLLEAAR